MAKGNKQAGVRAVVIVYATLLAAMMVVAGCKKEPQEPSNLNHNRHEQTSPESVANNTGDPKEAAPETVQEPKLRLRDVIAAARSWGPA
jgi:hypothetical protein